MELGADQIRISQPVIAGDGLLSSGRSLTWLDSPDDPVIAIHHRLSRSATCKIT